MVLQDQAVDPRLAEQIMAALVEVAFTLHVSQVPSKKISTHAG